MKILSGAFSQIADVMTKYPDLIFILIIVSVRTKCLMQDGTASPVLSNNLLTAR